ncbi:hypothetical protein BSKO_13705 [Bryopsis sp. KO-2023]|nr:hypothetical protein BSKO_13705 [Bryopsis sp. KO-2023]
MSHQASTDEKTSARLAESLGWLTESTLQPRKRELIEGVSGGTLVDLKAQLYRTQEESKLRKETGEVGGFQKFKKKLKGYDFDRDNINPGVGDRDKKDKLSMKTESDKADECYAALEKKAELYEKLMDGKASDEEEAFEVDFSRKKYMEPDEVGSTARGDTPHDEPTSDAEAVEDERVAEEKRRKRKELILEQAELTKEGRDRAARVKSRRESRVQRDREKLKAAFLKKQMAKLKANSGKKPE